MRTSPTHAMRLCDHLDISSLAILWSDSASVLVHALCFWFVKLDVSGSFVAETLWANVGWNSDTCFSPLF